MRIAEFLFFAVGRRCAILAYFYAFYISLETSGEAQNWKQTGRSIFFALRRAEIKYAKKSSGHDIFEDTRFATLSRSLGRFVCSAHIYIYVAVACSFLLHARLTELLSGPFYAAAHLCMRETLKMV